jgi:hypothetical protein
MTPTSMDGRALGPNGLRHRFFSTSLATLFLVACVALRLVWINYDPPDGLSWSAGVYTDEGFYTLDARHRALFGTEAPGDFHDSYIAPLLSAMQTSWFQCFGISLLKARLFDVTFGLLSLLLFWDALRLRRGLSLANAALVLLAFCPPFLFYNCLALQETPALFWLMVGLWFAQKGSAPDHSKLLNDALHAGAGLCTIAALSCKGFALLGGAALLVVSVQCGRRAWLAMLMGILVGGAAYSVFYWWPHHGATAVMSRYYAHAQFMAPSAATAVKNILHNPLLMLRYMVLSSPIVVLLAVASLRRAARPFFDPVPVVWLAAGTALCALSNYVPSRYYVLFIPSICWLGAIGCMGIAQATRKQVLNISVFVSLLYLTYAWLHRGRTVAEASAVMARLVPAGATVLGEFAPTLTMQTGARAAPFWPDMFPDNDPIGSIGADYVAVRHAPEKDKWWEVHYPWLMQKAATVAHFAIGPDGQYVVDVYRVRRPH